MKGLETLCFIDKVYFLDRIMQRTQESASLWTCRTEPMETKRILKTKLSVGLTNRDVYIILKG